MNKNCEVLPRSTLVDVWFSVLALTCLPSISVGAETPSLKQTENFIVQQISDKGQLSSVSCEEITVRYINYRGVQRSLVFSPRDVGYSLQPATKKEGDDIAPIDQVDHVVAKCVDSNCVTYLDEVGELSDRVGLYRLMPAAAAAGLLKALNHHQLLCGGKKKSLF